MGHSGDSDEIPFVNSSNPPANDKERLQILKVTHTYWNTVGPLFSGHEICLYRGVALSQGTRVRFIEGVGCTVEHSLTCSYFTLKMIM